MRLFLKISMIIAFGVLFGILCWLSGAYIGGNYAVDFRFLGVRGYEAMGLLGSIVGLFGGCALGLYIVFKYQRK